MRRQKKTEGGGTHQYTPSTRDHTYIILAALAALVRCGKVFPTRMLSHAASETRWHGKRPPAWTVAFSLQHLMATANCQVFKNHT